MIRLMVFLGNPGSHHRLTRHNLAWRQVEETDWIPRRGWQRKFQGSFCRVPGAAGRVALLKPETYMNKSGESVGAAATFYKISPSEVLVIHDDIELSFGEWQLKEGGGLGGHGGLRSLAAVLGSRDFYRLRMGVGRPSRGTAASFVLGRFTPEEEAWLPKMWSLGGRILEDLLSQEPETLPQRLRGGVL